jgi:predicted nuclease of predicted toxin-antitoxin system
MARLYADEDIPLPLVERLRALGHDVLTTLDAGQANQQVQDSVILAEATNQGRVVLTHNRKDFKRLHRATPGHAGIISCTRDDADPGGLAARIHNAVAANPNFAGKHIRVNKPA